MRIRLKPTYIVERVTDINLEDLKADGVKGLIFDLDNTIMAPKAGALSDDISNWLELVKKDFKISVVSNNPHQKYLEKACEILGCPVYGKAKKPRTGVASIALKEMDLLPNEVCMIGDRPLTDIWVGQRLGLITILVDPLIKHEEIILYKILRRLERIVIESPRKFFTQIKKR
jgi:HAD superfamily phosphatase (TIGR01668 family)